MSTAGKTTPPPPPPPVAGYSPAHLRRVALSPDRQRALDEQARNLPADDKVWTERKVNDMHDLLAAAQVGPGRLQVLGFDLADDLRVEVGLKVPVPLTPAANGELVVADRAVIGITYPRDLIAHPRPGTSLACLLLPAAGAFHPNLLPDRGQPLCFGPSVRQATPLLELVLAAYGLLSMQNVMLDPADAAGVLNVEAALWWQEHQDLIPLTRTPLFQPDDDRPAAGAEGGERS